MSQTIDLELKKAFPNYLVFIKYKEHQKENLRQTESRYIVYKKDALICSYFLRIKVQNKECKIAKIKSKLQFRRGQKEKINVNSLTFPCELYSKITRKLKTLSVNYICVNKSENYYEEDHMEFDINKYNDVYNNVKHIIKQQKKMVQNKIISKHITQNIQDKK